MHGLHMKEEWAKLVEGKGEHSKQNHLPINKVCLSISMGSRNFLVSKPKGVWNSGDTVSKYNVYELLNNLQ